MHIATNFNTTTEVQNPHNDDSTKPQKAKWEFSKIFQNVPRYTGTEWQFIWLMGNEISTPSTLEKLEQLSPIGNLGIFTGAMPTLDLVSKRSNIKYLLVLDISSAVEQFWKKIAPIIIESNNRQEFIYAFLNDHKGKFIEETINEKIEDKISWLSDEDQFKRIKKIFVKNRFAFLLLNTKDSSFVQPLSEAIIQHNNREARIKDKLRIDTIYTSNIASFRAINGAIKNGYIDFNMGNLVINTSEKDKNNIKRFIKILSEGGSKKDHRGNMGPELKISVRDIPEPVKN